MPAPATEAEKRRKLFHIIKSIHTVFFVTHGGAGLHGRPMAAAEVEENLSQLYFATSRDSGKVQELANDSQVLLGYTNASGSEWATIIGRARLVDDREKIKQMWSPFWVNWFEGPNDPKLVLIGVTPEVGEYWDSGSKLAIMAKLTVAAMTGKKVNEGENERLKL